MVEQVAADVATDCIQSGDEVVVDTSRPRTVLSSLAARSSLSDVVVTVFGYPYADSTPLKRLATHDGVTLRVSMVPPGLREVVTEGSVEYVPRTVYQTSRRPALDTDRRTIGLVQTPSLSSSNRHPLGCLSTFGKKLARTADRLIVETNPRLPRTPATEAVKRSALDYAVETDAALPTLPAATSETASDIADNVSDLVPAGATVQLGVGSVMAAIGDTLASARRQYSLWTGLLGESTRPLFESGSVDDVTACVAIGATDSFYEWVCGLDGISFVQGTVSHSPAELAKQDCLIAINGALQVDLLGQVNAETLSGRQVAGVGGQSAFTTAASNDPEGLAVLALPARTDSGTRKIVPALETGEVVTTPRYAIDAVVTEYGVARLSNRSVADRVRALIDVAHPDDRTDLRVAAQQSGLL